MFFSLLPIRWHRIWELLMMLTVITWLRWHLPDFSTVKLLFSYLYLISIQRECNWNYVNIPFLKKLFSVFICIHVDSLFSILSLGYNPLVSSSFILKLKLCLVWLEGWRKGEHPRWILGPFVPPFFEQVLVFQPQLVLSTPGTIFACIQQWLQRALGPLSVE